MSKFIADFIAKVKENILDLLGVQRKDSPSSSGQEQSGNVQQISPTFPTEVRPRPETELRLEANVQPQYRKSKSILTYREGVFYNSLIGAIDETRYQVFAKVRLADIFWLANEPENRKFHQNQIMCKHIDFLVCSKPSLAPVLGIELDDSSHKFPEHQERDKFKDTLFLSVGLPLLRLNLQSNYSSEFLRQQIKEKLAQFSPGKGES